MDYEYRSCSSFAKMKETLSMFRRYFSKCDKVDKLNRIFYAGKYVYFVNV